MSAVRKTIRRQNKCKSCGYTWYPRGKDISLKCPKCGSSSVGFSGLGVIGSILLLMAFSIFNFGGNNNSSSANISKTTSASVKTISATTPVGNQDSNTDKPEVDAASASVNTISATALVGNQDSNIDKPKVVASTPPTQISPADKTYTPEEISEMENEKQYHGDDEIVRKRLGLPSRNTGKMYP